MLASSSRRRPTQPSSLKLLRPGWLTLILMAFFAGGVAMTFTPSPDTLGHERTNWDNWGLIHNGTWYLFYIVGGECPGRWVAYGVATSTDGVHWTDKGDMMYPLTEPGKLQSCSNSDYALGSGWVWRSPVTGKWLVNWSQSNRGEGPGQSINFAEADSPEGPWQNITAARHLAATGQPTGTGFFRPDPRWYEVGGRWDTIRVVPKGPGVNDGWWGFITANPLANPQPPNAPPFPPPPPPPPPSPPPPPCTITHDFGCLIEKNCGANVSARCLGGAMIGGADTRDACACACHTRGFSLGGLERGQCFCAMGQTPDPAKCGAVSPSNASRVCTAGTGGGNCAVSVFGFSCPAGSCAPTPPPPPPAAIRPGFALCESSNGYDWTALPAPEVLMDPLPANPSVEASGVQPLAGPDGVVRWYALIGAAAWTSIGGRMGMFAYVATNVSGPYRQPVNYAVMAYEQGWVTPAYFLTFFPTEQYGMLVNHQVVAPGGGTIGGDYVAPLKAIHIDANGTLRLKLWQGNAALKGQRLQNSSGLNASLGFVAEGLLLTSLGETGRDESNHTRDERNPGRDVRKPGSGRVSDGVVGVLAMCACGSTSSECATSGVSVTFNGSDCTMTLSSEGRITEHIDRALTPKLLGSASGGTTGWTLLHRKGMWEFYVGASANQFLALPERMPTAMECVELQASGGLSIVDVWAMTPMPPSTPVKPAPTWRPSSKH